MSKVTQTIGVTAVELLRQRDEVFLTTCYKEVYPMIESFIIKNSGTSIDAQDITQDAFYLALKKVQDPTFELTSKTSTFIVGIARNLWLKQLTKKGISITQFQAEQEFEELPESELQTFTRIKKLEHAFVKLGEPCTTIIKQFYFFKKSMQEIADMLHYTNAENAKNQKYKCFNRLKKIATE